MVLNRTDLAIESHMQAVGEGVTVNEKDYHGITITEVIVETDIAAKRISKPKGRYVAIKATELLHDTEVYLDVCSLLAKTITELSDRHNDILVAGLGNRDITPDALGPEVVSRVFVTNHIKEQLKYDFVEKLGRVSAIAPGVLGTTGMETSEIIRGVANEKKPDLIIAVDAFAASDANNISTTIQVSDSGLIPGGGVGNRRNAINEETLGVPVIAIGVPTVVDADILSGGRWKGESLVVTPKDIDIVIDRAAKTIANGINMAAHPELTIEEIESYVG
ncbi:MAG: GPR endopeptidase [Eubacteriales bacterium]|nr:GPR endopeptidase [Eubacteriales bacterium]